MYNAEQKQRFLKEYNAVSVVNIINYFNKFELLESILEKDACDFTIKEIIDALKLINSSSIGYVNSIGNFFGVYTDWCINNGLVKDSQNHYKELNNEVLFNVLNRTLLGLQILTREQLMSIISQLENACDKVLLLALFEGIYKDSYSEIFYLSEESINGNEITTYTGRKLTVSNNLIELIKESCNTYEYYCYLNEDANCKTAVRKFDTADKGVFKTGVNAMYNNPTEIIIRQRLNQKIRRIQDGFNIPALKGKKIVESGRIEMINNYVVTENISALEVLKRHNEEITYRYGGIASYKRYVLEHKDFIKV